MSKDDEHRRKTEAEMVSVELPKTLIDEIEEIMRAKFERRPVPVNISRYISELLRSSIERDKANSLLAQALEEYGIEKDRVYIRDNERDIVAEISFKDIRDLYCNYDASKNCVHVGFALALPRVQRMVASHRDGTVG